MTSCCVVGCNNRYSPSSSLKFYRIPCGNRPFQVTRRRLWLKAIKKANGKDYEPSTYARICGAHFISGELSMDNESPDFVPSVFPNSIQKQNQSGLRRGRSRGLRENDEIQERPFSPEAPKAEPPVDLNTSVLMETEVSEETPSLSASEPKEEEALTKEVVPEIETMELQETSITNKTLPEQLQGILPVIKMYPVVLLKPLIILNGAFHCEQCSETFTSTSELVKHTQQHKEPKSSGSSEADLTEPNPVSTQETSFPCNMCDQSFTTSRNLKRHKLLHVKDCRKCLRCGTLFCRRHNHFLFWPRPELKAPAQEDSFTAEEDDLDRNFSPEKIEPDQMSEMAETVSFTDEHSVVVSELVPQMSETTETQPLTSLSDEPSALVSEQVLQMSETVETQPPTSTDEPSSLVPEQVLQMSETVETQPPTSTGEPSALVPEQVLQMSETAKTQPLVSLINKSLVSVPEQVPNMSETAKTQPPVSLINKFLVLVPEQVPNMSETAKTQPPVSLINKSLVLVPEQLPNMSETAKTQPPVSVIDKFLVLVPEQVPTMSETAKTQPPVSLINKSLVSVPELVLNTPCQLPEVKSALVSVQPPPAPCPPPPISTLLTNTDRSIGPMSPMFDPSDLGQYHLPQPQELPSALKIFSPQYLTSALLDVERNYEYILNRAKTVQIENVVEEEPEEPVFICPVEKLVKPAKGEKIAYDLEIIL